MASALPAHAQRHRKTEPAVVTTAPTVPLFFAQDDRLRDTITLNGIYTGSDLMKRLRKASHRAFVSEFDALGYAGSKIVVVGSDLPLSALMDGFAAFHHANWERIEPDGYRLLGDTQGSDFTFLIDDITRSADLRHETTDEWAQALSELPHIQGNLLQTKDGVRFTALPTKMQELLTRMTQATNRHLRIASKKSDTIESNDALPLDKLPTCSVRVVADENIGVAAYRILLRADDGSNLSWNFTEADIKRAEDQAKVAARGLQPRYIANDAQLSDISLRNLPALRRTVSINARQATLHEVLSLLNKQYGVAFIADTPPSTQPFRATIEIADLPLADALDKICAAFGNSRWEWRSLGILIVHDAANSKPPSSAQTKS